MSASMKVDLSSIHAFTKRLDDPRIRAELEALPRSKAIAALVSQAIADNFDKEGPGWAPLRPETLRRTVAKAVLKVAQQRAAYDMNALKFAKKTGKTSINRRRLKGLMAEFHERTGEHLAKMERAVRPGSTDTKSGTLMEGAIPGRMILQDTGLLKRAATTANFTGSNTRGVTGSNIYKFEGTTLIWGVSLIYAKSMQEGDPKKRVPARPYLVVRDVWMKQIEAFMVERVSELIYRTIEGGG